MECWAVASCMTVPEALGQRAPPSVHTRLSTSADNVLLLLHNHLGAQVWTLSGLARPVIHWNSMLQRFNKRVCVFNMQLQGFRCFRHKLWSMNSPDFWNGRML